MRVTALIQTCSSGSLEFEIPSCFARSRNPHTEVDALSVTMLVQHTDRAEQMAFIEEDRAWRYSDSFEQGKWRRVRKTIERLRHDTRPFS